MSEDTVPEILAAHVAMSEPSARLWQRVAHGGLLPDEAQAQLLEGRQDVGEEERGEIERAKQVFAPPSEEQRREQLEKLLAQRASAAAEAGDQGVVVSMQPHRTRRWVVGLLTAAAAAVLMVWLVPSRPGDGPPFAANFELELDKAAATVRGSDSQTEEPTFLLDGKIGIRLVPEEAVAGPVGVVAYVWDRSGRAERLEVEPIMHDNGVVELDTTVKALGLGEGEWELVIAVGWVQALPTSWEEIVDAGADGAKGFEVVRRRLRVVRRLSEGDGGE